MPRSAALGALLLLLALAAPARADEAGWRRAIAAGEAAYRTGDYSEATFAFSTALKNAESFGASDTRVATSLGWLAETYRLQARLAEAEPLLKRALAIRENVLGPTHPSTLLTRHNLNVLQKSLGSEATASASQPPAAPAPSTPSIAPLKPKPEPAVQIAQPAPVVEAPKPRPAPIVVEAPKPKPEPVVVAPKPEPKPAPVTIVEAPKPAPVVEVPKPKAEPVIEAPKPKPEPVVAPKPAPIAIVEPPKPAPLVEAPKPKPEPIVVAPKPAPIAIVEPPKPAPSESPGVLAAPLSALFQLFEPKPAPPAPEPPKPVPREEPPKPAPIPAAKPAPPRVEAPAPVPLVTAEVDVPKPRPVAPPIAAAALPASPPPEPKPAPVVEALKPAPVVEAPKPKPAPVVIPEPPKPAPIVEAPRPKPEPTVVVPKPLPIVIPEPPKPAPIVEAPKPVELPRIELPVTKPAPPMIASAAPRTSAPAAVVAAPAPSPAQAARSNLESQFAALGAPSRGNAAGAFELVQREREAGTVLRLAEVQPLLGEDEALVSYFIGERSSAMVVARRNRAEWHAIDTDRARLAAAVKQLRAQLDPAADRSARGQQAPFPASLAHQLWRTLLAPAAGALEGAAHLVIVPDGALQSLPFAALLTEPPSTDANAKRAWLARRHAVTTLPGEPALKRVRAAQGASAATRPFAGFGDPQLRGESGMPTAAAPLFAGRESADVLKVRDLPRLPDSRYVLDAMSDILDAAPADVRVGSEATEESVKRTRLEQYRVLAFGSYGLMAGEFPGAAQPGIVLTPPRFASSVDDGVLTAPEIAQLKLDAELVVLTAGATASADGTPGIEGLPRLSAAFLEAGSRALVVPHWTVNADSTLKLVSRMLRERSRGAGNAEALRRAMLALMDGEDRPAYAHPMYWAQFAVVGEGARASNTARAAK